MRAIVITKPGSPDVLQVQQRDVPVLRAGEVLVKVAAAGVNRPDVAQRKGNYPPPPGASPDVPGLEIAGTIVKSASDVTRWKEGDKVCALVTGGGYAEYCAVPAGQCLPVPAPLSMVEAASLPETFFTVWNNVFERGRLAHNETLLVHGGSSGIGVTAIQLAKAWGARVFVTAGSDDKCRACEQLGADKAINYKTQKFGDVVKALTDKRGVDVILDMIGGDYTPINLDVLAEEGRLVLINFMKGEETNVRLSKIMQKRLTITGSTLRARDVAFKSSVARQLEQHVWPWLNDRTVKPVVYKTFPLADAEHAHVLLESSAHIGKIILTVG